MALCKLNQGALQRSILYTADVCPVYESVIGFNFWRGGPSAGNFELAGREDLLNGSYELHQPPVLSVMADLGAPALRVSSLAGKQSMAHELPSVPYHDKVWPYFLSTGMKMHRLRQREAVAVPALSSCDTCWASINRGGCRLYWTTEAISM